MEIVTLCFSATGFIHFLFFGNYHHVLPHYLLDCPIITVTFLFNLCLAVNIRSFPIATIAAIVAGVTTISSMSTVENLVGLLTTAILGILCSEMHNRGVLV